MELFPPGTLGAATNPKLAALADAARGPATPVTPPTRPIAASPVADVGGAAVGEGATPRCLAILDKKEEDEQREDGTKDHAGVHQRPPTPQQPDDDHHPPGAQRRPRANFPAGWRNWGISKIFYAGAAGTDMCIR